MTGPVEAYMIHDYAEARKKLTNGYREAKLVPYGTKKHPSSLELLEASQIGLEATMDTLRSDNEKKQRQIDALVATVSDIVDKLVIQGKVISELAGGPLPAVEIGNPVVAAVLRLVSNIEMIPIAAIKGPSRLPGITLARHIVFYLACKTEPKTVVAACCGGRDHSTVSHALEKIKNMRETKPDFAQRIHTYEMKLAELTVG